jgi:hypothetical protein
MNETGVAHMTAEHMIAAALAAPKTHAVVTHSLMVRNAATTRAALLLPKASQFGERRKIGRDLISPRNGSRRCRGNIA